MTTRRHRLALALAPACLAAAALSSPAHAAASYDNCTDFIDSLPATISTQGVWCLRKNLVTSITSGAAITIATNNVTIDCNDFKIGGLSAGDASQAYGIHAVERLNATVRNCGIRGFFYGVIFLGGNGGGHLVEHNRFDQNLYSGIRIEGEDNLVRGNRIFDTGLSTIFGSAVGIYGQSDVVDNVVNGVYAAGQTAKGISVYGSGAHVSGNQVRRVIPASGYSANGIVSTGSGSMVTGNHVSNASSTPGDGIRNDGGDGFCTSNAVRGYVSAYGVCANAHANYPAP